VTAKGHDPRKEPPYRTTVSIRELVVERTNSKLENELRLTMPITIKNRNMFSIFQEERQAQILGEHISNVLHSGNGEYFNFTFFNLFLDVVIVYLYMLNPFLHYRILSIEDCSMTVTIDRDVWHGFSKFTE